MKQQIWVLMMDLTKTKKQRDKFKRGFFWGRIEHKAERLCTYTLLVGLLFQIAGLLTKIWLWNLIASVFFGLALVFRVSAGIAHRLEKYYMKNLRFGVWKK